MVTNSTGLVLITGSSHGLLSFREIWSLQELYSIDMNEGGAIRSLAFTEGMYLQHLGCLSPPVRLTSHLR